MVYKVTVIEGVGLPLQGRCRLQLAVVNPPFQYTGDFEINSTFEGFETEKTPGLRYVELQVTDPVDAEKLAPTLYCYYGDDLGFGGATADWLKIAALKQRMLAHISSYHLQLELQASR